MSEVEFTKASTEPTLSFGGEPASFKAKALVLTDEKLGYKGLINELVLIWIARSVQR